MIETNDTNRPFLSRFITTVRYERQKETFGKRIRRYTESFCKARSRKRLQKFYDSVLRYRKTQGIWSSEPCTGS